MSEYQESEKAMIAYVPVLHAGYTELFRRHPDADMYVLDQDVLDDFSHLRKDIRALQPELARDVVESLDIFKSVKLLGKTALSSLSREQIIMPDDDVSSRLHNEYFPDRDVMYEPVFLRWDRENNFVNVEVEPDREIEVDDKQEAIIHAIYQEAGRSSDWWRQVGAAVVKDDRLLYLGHNHHLPSEYTPWIDNDPRNNAYRGVSTEAATVQHAEASLVSKAAREGKSLEDTDLYVTTFPCPACAKLIAESGVKRCYYTEGYAMTDGLRVMKDHDMEIIKVHTDIRTETTDTAWRTYPKKK